MDHLHKIITNNPKAWASQLIGIDAYGQYRRVFAPKKLVSKNTWQIDVALHPNSFWVINDQVKGCYQVLDGVLIPSHYPAKYDLIQDLHAS